MKRFFLCLFLSLISQLVSAQPDPRLVQKIPDFAGFTRRYLVSLSTESVDFILFGLPHGARPNYNWALAYGYSPICTLDEVKKIRENFGAEEFSKYGQLINFGWLYDQREFVTPLRRFLTILKKDKSQDARVLEHVVEKSLEPASIEQQKSQIQNEIERNEKRLSKKSGLSRAMAAAMAKNYSRRFKACLGRYQTGYTNLALQLNHH